MNRKPIFLSVALMMSVALLANADDGTSDGGGDECHEAPKASFNYACTLDIREPAGDRLVNFEVNDSNIGEGYLHIRREFPQSSRYRNVSAYINFCPLAQGDFEIFAAVHADLRNDRPVSRFSGSGFTLSTAEWIRANAGIELNPRESFGVYLSCRQEYWRQARDN